MFSIMSGREGAVRNMHTPTVLVLPLSLPKMGQ